MKFSGFLAAAFAVGSAVAAPTRRAAEISNILDLVSNLKNEVTSDLASIPAAGEITAEVAPTVQKTLQNVIDKVQDTTNQLAPLILSIGTNAGQGDIANVNTAVSDVKELVSKIQNTAQGLADSPVDAVTGLIQPLLQAVTGIIFPIATLALGLLSGLPIVGGAAGALGNSTQGLGGAAGGLQGLVNGLLGGVLSGGGLGNVAGGVLGGAL
ncbi:hypothetical protein VTK73DRAFT_6207 [Phialemonium thermophilum]|uniref:Uncharacterized protein n=1 Tax=Phialemonium thermophilum TaxID=223376 RepID=A0ABR3XW01_9PEZI